VLITHDEKLAAQTRRIVNIMDGVVFEGRGEGLDKC
jgi:predicted ABC-type transport system involved in lysophospholipase L1 biosynthesis ATPase subunit